MLVNTQKKKVLSLFSSENSLLMMCGGLLGGFVEMFSFYLFTQFVVKILLLYGIFIIFFSRLYKEEEQSVGFFTILYV